MIQRTALPRDKRLRGSCRSTQWKCPQENLEKDNYLDFYCHFFTSHHAGRTNIATARHDNLWENFPSREGPSAAGTATDSESEPRTHSLRQRSSRLPSLALCGFVAFVGAIDFVALFRDHKRPIAGIVGASLKENVDDSGLRRQSGFGRRNVENHQPAPCFYSCPGGQPQLV